MLSKKDQVKEGEGERKEGGREREQKEGEREMEGRKERESEEGEEERKNERRERGRGREGRKGRGKNMSKWGLCNKLIYNVNGSF